MKYISIISMLIATSMAAATTDTKEISKREKFFTCLGHDNQTYEDSSKDNFLGSPTNSIILIRDKTVKISDAWQFPNAEVPINKEDEIEIHFEKMITSTLFGDYGSFNKVTGHLRLDATDGIANNPQHVTSHWWGEYECKPTKKML